MINLKKPNRLKLPNCFYPCCFGAIVGLGISFGCYLAAGHGQRNECPVAVAAGGSTAPAQHVAVVQDTSASMVNPAEISKSLEDWMKPFGSEARSAGVVIPVKDLSVRACWPRGSDLKCDVSYTLTGHTVSTTIQVDRETSTVEWGSYYPVPTVSDFEMTDCRLTPNSNVSCQIALTLRPFYGDDVMKITSTDGRVPSTSIEGTIVFDSYHPTDGTYEGQLHEDGAQSSTTIFVLRETFQRVAPELLVHVPAVQ